MAEMTTSDRTLQILGQQLGDAGVRAAAAQAYIETLENMVAERDRRIREMEGERNELSRQSSEAPTGYADTSQDGTA